MNRGLINSSQSTAWDGTIQFERLTIGTIALALFVILGSLVPLFAQTPAQQQQPKFVKQDQQLIHERKLPNVLALYRQPFQTSPDSLVSSIAEGSVLDLMGKGQETRNYFAKAMEVVDEREGNATAKRAMAISLIGTAISAPASSQTPSSSAASAQGEVPEVRVAVVITPPMVMEQNGSLTGFGIDLWNAIATRLKIKTSYQIMPDVSAVEEALRSKSADLSPVAVISLARDEDFDFSYPILDTGLQIMVRETGATQRTADRPVLDMLRLLFSRTTIEWCGVALLLVLIPAHLAWLLERRHPDGIISSRKYFPGIFQAIFWGISTLTSQAEGMPREWLARAMSVFWMFASVVFIASYTAQLTTTLTVEQIRGAIEGPADLPGKQVATMTSTVAADYLRKQNVQLEEFSTPDQMFSALLDKKVDAVVMQAPLLLYYAAHEGKGRVKVVGPEFNSGQVAILVQVDSPLRKKINRALVTLRENGTYQQIYDKWFGGP